MRSRIHDATVAAANIAYVSSITIGEEVLERAGLWPDERPQVRLAHPGSALLPANNSAG
jgi:aspartate 1-decarboxylase